VAKLRFILTLFLGFFVTAFGNGRESFMCEVQGHRGARSLFAENTLPSFEAAIEAGADVLELDLHVSHDGALVIYHDFFTNPKMIAYLGGKALKEPQLIRDLSLEEIKLLDCGLKRNPKFPRQQLIPGTQIPALGELIEFIQHGTHPNYKKIRLNIELKRDERHPEWSFDPADFAEKVVEEVKKHGFEDRVYYSSFDPEILLEIHHVDPEAKVGFIYNADSLALLSQIASKDELEFLFETAFSLKASILSPDHKMLHDKEQVQTIQRKGFRVIPWTVNEPNRWKELIDMGVDGIISDYPEELILFLK